MSVIDRTDNIRRLAQRLRQFARYSIGRVLGTVHNDDGRYRWFIDNQERSLFMCAEMNALTSILIKKNVCTPAEWQKVLEEELDVYLEYQREIWPEVTVAEDGISYSLDVRAAQERMAKEGWPP